ncbi:hypothetical protein So717_32340 [Roseobacter cerasinus]|uniref:Uncharacterized protein n=1 Tax=Roseobacter cerasinus TaxID=2602289 RepID=A0A640VWM2_9RHOB|nr:hypothetical protein [Roseobacter cerasinus]GFE51481.1 hypothetical protein So717_32340 [Roseobacter cerasinus]
MDLRLPLLLAAGVVLLKSLPMFSTGSGDMRIEALRSGPVAEWANARVVQPDVLSRTRAENRRMAAGRAL